MREAYKARHRKLVAKRYNEQKKLQSSLLNTLAAAVIISAFVFPVIREGNFSSIFNKMTWFWLFLGFMLHLIAVKLASWLKSED